MSNQPTTPPPDLEELDFELPKPPQISKSRLAAGVLVTLAVLVALFVVGLLPKLQKQALANSDAHERTGVVRVQTVKPKPAAQQHTLTLPASVQALQETTVFSRANGYVRRWTADIGDKVKVGQLLAEIDTPELDQELQQSRAVLGQRDAALVQAKANLELARTQEARTKALAPSGVATQQELEQRQAQAQVEAANVLAAEAAVRAQKADLSRLQQIKAFSRVTAPFNGIVTWRGAEQGMLVTAGTASRLYTVAVADPVRVFIQVPQSLAAGVTAGLPAKVSVQERPGELHDGQVSRTAGALDPSSRTLNTEIRVPNPRGQLLVGSFANVTLTIPSVRNSFRVPASALLSRANGVRLAVVGKDSKIVLVPVVVERDDGSEVEISTGLHGGEDVVSNPGARIEEGLTVSGGAT